MAWPRACSYSRGRTGPTDVARALLPLPNRMRMVDVIVIVCDMRGLLAALPLMDGSVVLERAVRIPGTPLRGALPTLTVRVRCLLPSPLPFAVGDRPPPLAVSRVGIVID